jgi:hypothetical protein
VGLSTVLRYSMRLELGLGFMVSKPVSFFR